MLPCEGDGDIEQEGAKEVNGVEPGGGGVHERKGSSIDGAKADVVERHAALQDA